MGKTRQKIDATTGSSRKPSARQLVDEFGLNVDDMSPTERRSAVSGYDMRHRIEAMVAGVTAKKIRHIYKGDGAATAPGMMILPRIPATHLFPMRHVRVLLGYTAHEISHQLKTDFGLLQALIDDKTRPMRQKQQIKEFWNAIEDYRIEKLVRKDYPGFHVYIDDTRDFSAGRFVERVTDGIYDAKALSNPYRIGAVALTWIGAELNSYRTSKPREALNLLDPKLLAWLESWRSDMAAVETCVDARDLAIVIVEELDRLREHEPEDDGESGKGNGSKNQQGQQGGQPQQGKPGDKQQGGSSSQSQGGTDDADDSQQGGGQDDPGNDAPGASDEGGTSGDQDDAPQQGGDGGDQAESAGDKPEGDGQDGGGKGDSDADGDKDEPDADGGSGDGDEAETDGGAGDDAAGDDDQASDAEDGKGDGEPQDDDATEDEEDGKAQRPDLDVNQGDEEAAAEAADLEIDDLSRAIRSIKGPEAVDPSVTEGQDLASKGRGSSGGSAEEIVQQAIERGQTAYSKMRQDVGGAAARSAGILRRMLMAQKRRTWRGGREDGELDFGRLVPMVDGQPDIYRQKFDRSGVNTALTLLLDNSGSMGGHPIRVCQETAIVLDMAIQGTPTKIEIVGFTGSAQCPVLYRYRAFGQSGQLASASLGNMDQVSLGGTPVSTPLLESWRRLSQQKEPRRIMIVVSDGGADWNDVEASRQAHDFIVSQGCRIIGIAIGCIDDMSAWCDNCQAIESIDDLPVALTKLVQETMR